MHALVKVVLVFDVFVLIHCAESQQKRQLIEGVPTKSLRTPKLKVPQVLSCIYTTRRGSPVLVRDNEVLKQELPQEKPAASVSIGCPKQDDEYRSLCGRSLEIFEADASPNNQLSREKQCGAEWEKWVVGLRPPPTAVPTSHRRRLQRCASVKNQEYCAQLGETCRWDAEKCRILTKKEKKELEEAENGDFLWAFIVGGVLFGLALLCFVYWWHMSSQWVTFYQDKGVYDEDGETKICPRTDVRLYSSQYGVPKNADGDKQARKAGYTVHGKGSKQVAARGKSQKSRKKSKRPAKR